jgi:hypothetical protein
MLRCTKCFSYPTVAAGPRFPDFESTLRLEGECGDRDHRPAGSNNMPEDISTYFVAGVPQRRLLLNKRGTFFYREDS